MTPARQIMKNIWAALAAGYGLPERVQFNDSLPRLGESVEMGHAVIFTFCRTERIYKSDCGRWVAYPSAVRDGWGKIYTEAA